MFIRSQSRKNLINTECIFIDDNINVIGVKDKENFYLGTYKTRTRALEVLDMIQDAIEDGMSCHEKALIDKYGTTQSWKRHTVFEMPKI